MGRHVSIHCITYRHERFLGEAIDSVLAQDHDDWELVIAEDGSDDGTLAVARDYERRHPDRIRVLAYRHRGDIGKVTFADSFTHCRGDYIANIDGDDLWTDPGKLRRQIEILESAPELAGTFHDMALLREGRVRGSLGPRRSRRFDELDMVRGVHLSRSSAMFRGGLVDELPVDYFDERLHNGDMLEFLLFARCGPLAFDPTIAGAYRQHGNNLWSGRSKADQMELNMGSRRVFRAMFPGDYDLEIDRYLRLRAPALAGLHLMGLRPVAAARALVELFAPQRVQLDPEAERPVVERVL